MNARKEARQLWLKARDHFVFVGEVTGDKVH